MDYHQFGQLARQVIRAARAAGFNGDAFSPASDERLTFGERLAAIDLYTAMPKQIRGPITWRMVVSIIATS